MKFLTIGSMQQTPSTMIPPAVVRQLVEATIAVTNQQMKAGKILEAYWIPGWRRVVAISEVKTAEEAIQLFSEVPVNQFMNYEVYPLADYNGSMKIMLESLKAMEKMMPTAPK